MFVAFEGIDGSGKTSLSNLVCDRLRAAGRPVVHAREKGVLATAVARRVRELTRDARLLEMSPRAELFLNLARETQQLDQLVRPALAAGHVVIADRSLHSLVALAVGGRGLPAAEVRDAVAVGAGGTWPDVVVLVDVDPDLARLRKRAGKILDGREGEADSRKGLCGAGLQVRIAAHLRADAAAAPDRWIVARNEGRSLAALAGEVAAELLRRLDGAPAGARVRRAPPRNLAVLADPAPAAIAGRFRRAVEALAGPEPALAAALLAGIPGDAEDALRAALAACVPALVARGLRGLSGPAAWTLRDALAARVPGDVAASLAADASAEAMALRDALLDRAPGAVAAGLAGIDGPAAWSLRERALSRGALPETLAGLAGLDGARAWEVRADGLRHERWAAVGRSLAGVAGPRAEALRERLAEHDRLAAIRATTGVDGPVSGALREALYPHAAKLVLRSLAGVDAPYAWALRADALARTKEALDSVDGMDGARAWALRSEGVARWPATAVSSLRTLAGTPRGRALVAEALRGAPGSLVVLRNAHAALARAAAGPKEEPCSISTRSPPAAVST